MVSTNRRAEDSNEMKLIHLIQRYQDSVDLLNKAAEGLVEVIMSWRPTLDAQSAALFGPQHHDSFNASPLVIMSQVLQPNSVFVATVAEVEELEFKVKEEKKAKRTAWCLMQWCLQVLRRREAKHGKEREAFHTSVDEMRRISDAIREKSVPTGGKGFRSDVVSATNRCRLRWSPKVVAPTLTIPFSRPCVLMVPSLIAPLHITPFSPSPL